MGLYDEEVKAILGQEAWDILVEIVDSDVLDGLKMKETARKLHPTVGGGHLQRTGPAGRRDSDWHEMREVLSHWYQMELYEFDGRKAVDKLVTILESDAVDLPNVAGQLKSLSTKPM